MPFCRPTALSDARRAVGRLNVRLWGLWLAYTAYAGIDAKNIDLPDLESAGKVRAFCLDERGCNPERERWLREAVMGKRDQFTYSCLWHVDQAASEARLVVREVGTGKPPPVCPGCRRIGTVGQPRRGGLCFACDKRQQRSGVRQRTTTVRAWARKRA